MRSYDVTNVWGIPIRVNVSLLVFLPVLAWLIGSGQQIPTYAGLIASVSGVGFDTAQLQAGATPWAIGVVAAVGLFVSVALHELGHSWVALRYGIEIESITLWILGGMAALSSIPREWNREFWIAIAGPTVSVGVGAVCYGGLLATPASVPVVKFVFGWLAITNVVLAAFNLLPAFPMDGGRIFRALLARTRPYGTATRLAARVGVGFALLFAVVGVLSFSPLLLLLALFVYGAATTESKTVLLHELLDGLTVGDLMERDAATVEADTTVAAFADRLLGERRSRFLVTDGGDVVGAVSVEDVRSVSGRDRDATTLRDVMREPIRVRTTDDAFETLGALQQSGTNGALVEDGGRVVGLLSTDDYARAMTIRRGFYGGVGGMT